MAIFFLFELYKFIVTLIEVKRPEPAEQLDEEEIKRRAIEEYLASKGGAAENAAGAAAEKAEEIKEKAAEVLEEKAEEIKEKTAAALEEKAEDIKEKISGKAEEIKEETAEKLS